MSSIKLNDKFRHNLIINGGFDFWQRGNTPITLGGFLADRWGGLPAYTGGVTTFGRVEDSPNINTRYCMEVKHTTAPTSSFTEIGVRNTSEKGFSRPYLGKKTILSFWVKSNVSTLFTRFFPNYGLANGINTGREIVINTPNTWEFKSFIFDLSGITEVPATSDVDSGMLLDISFGNSVIGLGQSSINVNDYYRISQVMITEGQDVQDFVRAGVSLPNELQLCQRYFEKSYNIETPVGSGGQRGFLAFMVSNTSFHRMNCMYKVRKRGNAVVLVYSNIDGSLNFVNRDNGVSVSVGNYNSSERTFSFQSGSFQVNAEYTCQWTADAEL